MAYVFMTDSNSDIPYWLAEKYSIPVILMPSYLGEEEVFSDLGKGQATERFFTAMKSGINPTTSLLTPDQYLDIFRPHLLNGNDILYVAFSTKMSATQENAAMAIEQLKSEYPDRRILMVDTLCISAGMAVLVAEAIEKWQSGATMDDVAAFVMSRRMCAHHWFAVDDLKYLKRGGRISATSAIMGTVLDIKPILSVSAEGRVVPYTKVQGRRKAIRTLIEKVDEYVEKPEDTILYVIHADCQEEAQKLVSQLKERAPYKDVWLGPVGPSVGTHCGPGTVAICFMGKDRSAL